MLPGTDKNPPHRLWLAIKTTDVQLNKVGDEYELDTAVAELPNE